MHWSNMGARLVAAISAATLSARLSSSHAKQGLKGNMSNKLTHISLSDPCLRIPIRRRPERTCHAKEARRLDQRNAHSQSRRLRQTSPNENPRKRRTEGCPREDSGRLRQIPGNMDPPRDRRGSRSATQHLRKDSAHIRVRPRKRESSPRAQARKQAQSTKVPSSTSKMEFG